MNNCIIGDKSKFAIGYSFFDDTRETELSMYVEGINLLEYIHDGAKYTTRWNLNDLVVWLSDFLKNMSEDPFPYDVKGACIAEKDNNARDFDTDDIDEFDAYYDKLSNWNSRHRWHPASSGAYLADVYFALIGSDVELSWDNTDAEDGIEFISQKGYTSIPEEVFKSVMGQFIKEYANHWYKP
ncbi:MAG: hypothetical protein IKG30_09480 [Clostridiales bacterium]|nr:hypothetical protein [Clostridiales bacterium]